MRPGFGMTNGKPDMSTFEGLYLGSYTGAIVASFSGQFLNIQV